MDKLNKHYDAAFYDAQSDGSYNSAKIVLPKVLAALPKINSVVDFGCGVGTWLAVFKELGVNEIKGYDGNWVNKNMLKIPVEYFTNVELDKGVTVDKKYDLAISLEVAEHLPHNAADLFVESLTKAADFVLFSAAIPFQGGTNHINEQWPEYWNTFFNKHGFFAMDFLRQQIWNEKKVEWWYRQNIFIFVRKERANEIAIPPTHSNIPLSLVHPDIYFQKTRITENFILKKIVNLLRKIKWKLMK